MAPGSSANVRGKAPVPNIPQAELHRQVDDQNVSYFLLDGTETTANPMGQIHDYLLARGDCRGMVSMDKLKEDVGIDLKDPRNALLLQILNHNETVQVGQSTLRRKHPMSIESELQLYRLFQYDIPGGIVKTGCGLSVLGVSEKQLVGCFDGVDMCIDEMIKDGVVQEIFNRDSRSRRRPERVFFPAPMGMSAPKDICDVWNSMSIPDDAELKKQLLERKLRTPQYYEMRKQLVKETNERETKSRQTEKQRIKDKKKANRDAAKFDSLCDKRGWERIKL